MVAQIYGTFFYSHSCLHMYINGTTKYLGRDPVWISVDIPQDINNKKVPTEIAAGSLDDGTWVDKVSQNSRYLIVGTLYQVPTQVNKWYLFHGTFLLQSTLGEPNICFQGIALSKSPFLANIIDSTVYSKG